MKKRMLAFIMVIVAMLSLAACSKGSGGESDTSSPSSSSQVENQTPSEPESQAPSETESQAPSETESQAQPEDQTPAESQESAPSEGDDPGEAPESEDQDGAMAGSGDLGDYHVEIKGASLVKDYKENPAILITYAWTNNSKDTTSAMVAVAGKAFQDGVELESAILVGVDGYDAESSMKEVRPGATLDVQRAYVLTSETSTVEFELSELISFSDDIVSMDFDPTALS